MCDRGSKFSVFSWDEGRNQDKRDKKDYGTKFRNTLSYLLHLLSMYLWEILYTAPPHLYNWDNFTFLRCLLVSCCLSNDDNLDRALYSEGSCFPVEELNMNLLIRHTPSLCDAIDVVCFPIPPVSLLMSWPNCLKLEWLSSVNRFLTVIFLIWMELLFKTFLAFFPVITLFLAFLLLVGFCYLIINNNSGAPWVTNFSKLTIRENLVMT